MRSDINSPESSIEADLAVICACMYVDQHTPDSQFGNIN